MADTKRNQPSVGKIANGEVIGDQGTVPYNGPKTVATPNTINGKTVLEFLKWIG